MNLKKLGLTFQDAQIMTYFLKLLYFSNMLVVRDEKDHILT